MSKQMSIFDSNKVNLPAHLSKMFGDESNLDISHGPPSLSIRGKVFRINMEGEETMLTRYDEELEDYVPLSSTTLIVLNQGPFGARAYYVKEYDPDTSSGPDCFSLDGKVPDAASPAIQSKTCDTCPHAVKGSKISPSGNPTTACTYQRRLAVVPARKPEFKPLLLRLAPTSAYDPETKNAENGWFAWRQYLDFLNSRGVQHTAQVVTKIRFDSDAEHPKLLFRPERFLEEAEAKIVAPRIEADEVMSLLLPQVTEGTPATTPPAQTAAVSEPAEPVQESEPEPAAPQANKKKAGKKVSKKKTARRAAPQSSTSEAQESGWGDDGSDEQPARNVASGTKSSATAQDSSIEDLLNDWADDTDDD